MAEEGRSSGDRKSLHKKGGLPPVTVLEVTGRDDEGDLIAKPAVWEEAGERPEVLIASRNARGPRSTSRRASASATACWRASARSTIRTRRLSLRSLGDQAATAREAATARHLPGGIERRRQASSPSTASSGAPGRSPRATKARPKTATSCASISSREAALDAGGARSWRSIGNPDDQRQISLIAMHAHGIPDDFPRSVIARARRGAAVARGPHRSARTSRSSPSIRADAATTTTRSMPSRTPTRATPAARSSTSPSPTSRTMCGPAPRSTARRICAATRSISPTASCRCCPSASPTICARSGRREPRLPRRAHGVRQARPQAPPQLPARVMRSAAKLSYQQAQAAIDGQPDDKTGPLLEPILQPLWAPTPRCDGARQARAARSRSAGAQDHARRARAWSTDVIVPRAARGHRLIEEIMIPANVAAAETLEQQQHAPALPRPRCALEGKAAALRDFLDTLDMQLPQADAAARDFNRMLAARQTRPSPNRQRDRAAQPGAGRVRRREHRPFRPRPAPLRALHLADPPLCRPDRASRADPRAAASARTG